MLQFVAVLNVKESSVVYDSKIEHYRTPEINSVIGGVAQLSKGLGEIKKSDSQNLFEKSDLVPIETLLSNRFREDLKKLSTAYQFLTKSKSNNSVVFSNHLINASK